MHTILRYAVTFAAGSALVVLLPLSVGAQSFDGTYDGTISCGLVTDMKQVWKTPLRMTVEDGEARYERPILRHGHSTCVSAPEPARGAAE